MNQLWVIAMPSLPATRHPFRVRLTVRFGVVLGTTLLVLGSLTVLGVWILMNHNARTVLHAEAHNLETNVERTGQLDLDAYPWHETHHRFVDPHIDPYFIQVFDVNGRLLRYSDNVTYFADTFPARLLPLTTDDLSIGPLRTFETNNLRFYYHTAPLNTAEGVLLGYLQMARYEPGIATWTQRIGLGIAAGYVIVLVGLLALLWTVGGYVVRPLASITTSARHLSSHHLAQRIPIPDDADQETSELGQALNDALQRLEQAFDEVRRFTASAAHELQTPLTVLQGHIEVALRRPRTADAYRDTLTVLHAQTETLIRTVRSLLTLSRLDETPPAVETVRLSQLLQEEVMHYQSLAEAKGISLQLSQATEGFVQGQATLLREAIHNVLDNAIKYTNQGSITVRLTQDKSHVSITITDTGRGIHPEHLQHVTERFWRAHDADVPGSGLGLAIVDQIVKHHQGHLTIDTQPNEGTTVHLSFPEAATQGTR